MKILTVGTYQLYNSRKTRLFFRKNLSIIIVAAFTTFVTSITTLNILERMAK